MLFPEERKDVDLMSERKSKTRLLILLNILLLFYSTGGIFSKLAASEDFFSLKFCIYYVIVIALLGGYALGWQQIIKRMPLTTAFANKAITVVWGFMWGALVFNEKITVGKIIGALLVMAGVVLFSMADRDKGK